MRHVVRRVDLAMMASSKHSCAWCAQGPRLLPHLLLPQRLICGPALKCKHGIVLSKPYVYMCGHTTDARMQSCVPLPPAAPPFVSARVQLPSRFMLPMRVFRSLISGGWRLAGKRISCRTSYQPSARNQPATQHRGGEGVLLCNMVFFSISACANVHSC